MKVVGFNFTRINAELTNPTIKQAKINAGLNISSINSLKSSLLNTGEDILGVEFEYSLQYEPDFAKISLSGNVLFSLESKFAKEILKEWKEKKIHEEFKTILFNFILKKASLKALELEDELNIPSHIPLPSLKQDKDKGSKED